MSKLNIFKDYLYNIYINYSKMLPMFKFQVEFLGEEIRRFRQVKDITEYYGIPKPSIFLCINGKIDYINGKWAGFKIFQILEPAYELLEY